VGAHIRMVGAIVSLAVLAGAAGVADAVPLTAGAARITPHGPAALPAAPRPAPTLTVAVATAVPEQSLPSTIILSGTATADSTLLALVRPAGAPCARSFRADRQGNRTGSLVLADGVTEATGVYQTTVSWAPDETGAYLICAWLRGGGDAGPVGTPVTVRGPQVPVLSVGFSATPTASTTFDIQYTTQTDQPLRLLSTIRPAGTAPACAATQPTDVAAHPGERVLFSGGVPVSGGPALTSIAVRYPAGAYLICTWITGPSTSEGAATLATPFTVDAQPIVQRAVPAQLRITALAATARSPVTVRGTSAAGLSGTLTLTAKCAASSSRGTATASHGRFTAQLALPRLCLAHDRINVSADWAGSPAFTAATAVATAVVDPAAGRTPALPLLFSRIAKVGRRYRDVFEVRPRTIAVGPVELVVHWTKWTAQGGRGVGIAHPTHGTYRVAVHAFHPVRGRFACLTVTRGTGMNPRARHYGLGRLGNVTFAWLHVGWLHRRASGATPWPRPGCPA
jgi:hypothetical protein